MFTLIAGWWAKDWVKLGVFAGVLVAIAASYFYVYENGKRSGNAAGQREQLEIGKVEAAQERAGFLAALQTAQASESEARAGAEAADRKVQESSRRLSALEAARAAAQQQVGKVPNDGLVADIRGKLGVKPDLQDPNLAPDELRAVDSIVTDYGNLKDQVAQFNAKLDALQDQVSHQGDRITAIQQERDAAIAGWNSAHSHYVEAYNAAQKKPPIIIKIITLGLYKGRHMDLPDPVTLQPPAQKK